MFCLRLRRSKSSVRVRGPVITQPKHVAFWRKCNANNSKKYLTNFASVAGKSWRATAVEAIDLVDASSVVQTSNIDTVIYICRRENQKILKNKFKKIYMYLSAKVRY